MYFNTYLKYNNKIIEPCYLHRKYPLTVPSHCKLKFHVAVYKNSTCIQNDPKGSPACPLLKDKIENIYSAQMWTRGKITYVIFYSHWIILVSFYYMIRNYQ